MELALKLGESKIPAKIEYVIYEKQYETKKEHKKVGHGNIHIADVVNVSVQIMKHIAEDRLWIGLIQSQVRGKWVKPAFISRVILDQISNALNGNDQTDEQVAEENYEEVDI